MLKYIYKKQAIYFSTSYISVVIFRFLPSLLILRQFEINRNTTRGEIGVLFLKYMYYIYYGFQARDKVVRSMTKRVYDCIVPPGINSHSSKLLHLNT